MPTILTSSGRIPITAAPTGGWTLRICRWVVAIMIATALAACDTCDGQSCFIGGTSIDNSAPGSTPAANISEGVYVGSTDVQGVGNFNLTMTADGNKLTGRMQPGNQVVTLFFGTGRAFLDAAKGGQLQDGSRIASGPINNLLVGNNGTVTMTIPFTGQGTHSINLLRDARRSNIDASPARIAGRYIATDDTGVTYDITVEASDSATFAASDSDGCLYRLETVFRPSPNVYTASGDFDPACESGGANFINGATWNEQITSAVWFVDFRGDSFALDLVKR